MTPDRDVDTLPDMVRPPQPDRSLDAKPNRSPDLSIKTALGLLLAITLFFPADAQAYLDPGTGSMIIQVIVGGVAGAIVIVKMQWARIQRFFGGKPLESPGRDQDHVDH